MPDRRQGDRREGGSKKITVSLSTFVFTVLIAVIIVVAVIICIVSTKKSYNNGYSQAIIDTSNPVNYYDDDFTNDPSSDFSATGTAVVDDNTAVVSSEDSNAVTSSTEQ